MLAHDDARAPWWATRADSAGDCPLRLLTGAPPREAGGLAIASQDARAPWARHIASQTERLRLLTSSAAVSSNLSHDLAS